MGCTCGKPGEVALPDFARDVDDVADVTAITLSATSSRESMQAFPTTPSRTAMENSTPLGTSTTKAARSSQLEFVRHIGKGAFGNIFLVKQVSAGMTQLAALKVMHISSATAQSAALRENNVAAKKLHHPNIIKYTEVRVGGGGRYIGVMMQYHKRGSLQQKLRREGHLSEAQALDYTLQLVKALGYLHEHGVVHRDLKSDNLLLSDKNQIVVSDFGCCGNFNDSRGKSTTVAGTRRWMAPEVFSGEGHDSSVDIWSLGCCVLEMLTGEAPFAAVPADCLAQYQAQHAANPEDMIPASITNPVIRGFIATCLARKSERATPHDLRRHPWLTGVSPQSSRRQSSSGMYSWSSVSECSNQIVPLSECSVADSTVTSNYTMALQDMAVRLHPDQAALGNDDLATNYSVSMHSTATLSE
eukprot:NODE_67_length_2888_cov_53.890257_g63_i0.p1 GENE.NODE_67_length_2888_cov_53.890257_g63_i0~~NODE_67_length_2888_cov_53.890257_g63_i0.p1  ORF type:complete len:415 (+),score=77.21 NODE_67_length_2888_cov_53.890257_g63_i0:66-1310(+)